MKIAIIRGPNLNPYEMQSYLPLAKEHALFGFATRGAPFCEDNTEMKVSYLSSPARLTAKVPAPLRRITRRLLSRGLGAAWTWMFGLEKRLQGMDIIHTAETANGYSFQALRAKRKWGGALVVTAWETIPFNFENHAFSRYVKREVSAAADHFIAVTERARECLQAEGVEASRISVIPAGIDLQRFQPGPADSSLRAALNLKDHIPTVLFMGRLVREKGVHDLLESLHHIRLHFGLQANLLMVGEGRERRRLAEKARRFGLEKSLHLQPPWRYEKTPDIYRLADVFVLPSRSTRDWEEQFGMVLVEAMACGLPIVGTRSGAISEVVGEAGILVEPDSPVRLAEGIARLLRSAELRKSLSTSGIRRAKKQFSHMQVSRHIEEVYQMVFEKAHGVATVCPRLSESEIG
ncbi:MAG: glycosyltransferase [Armatimonadetes bacterium]|nr:glycosyltransferase [Armatimonadota bacterium]NIM23295.1 glycosyltransferase [Armatimonadota bacterium]NIM67159.1 glycosyltransferase [Armatimonadota bacterium]NIM75686.1 glycosyltransferase [Armatimonadota bacterium]NIN05348.1 glycosyltransferase [Armatimonadota bacterium]